MNPEVGAFVELFGWLSGCAAVPLPLYLSALCRSASAPPSLATTDIQASGPGPNERLCWQRRRDCHGISDSGMTAPVTLKVERVSKLHTPPNALPGLRSHQLQLALLDIVAHHLHAGQHLWLQLPHAPPASLPVAAPLSLPVPVWLLVQAWAHAAVAPGTTRLQLSSSNSSLSAPPAIQPGDTVSLQPLTGPLLPASAITLRRLAATDDASSDDTASQPGSGNNIQPAIDTFIVAKLLNRPCHVGMAVCVELFNTAQHLIIDHIEPAPSTHTDPASPPALYTASSTTDITVTKHSTAGSAKQPADEVQAVDFCQSAAPLTERIMHACSLLAKTVRCASDI